MSSRVGIRDVAAAAGVSVTTVSHALNGKGRLPDRTRAHVRAIAESLGYRPNAAARSLAGGKTGLLGLVVSQEEGLEFSVSDFAYFGQLMAGATAAAMRRGYAVVLMPPDLDLAVGVGLPLDGAIIVDPTFGDPAVASLQELGIPVVTTGRIPDETQGAAWVDNNHRQGTRSMLDHLARQGANRIAMVTSRPLISYTVDAELAYRTWCEKHQMAPLVAYVRGGLTESAGFAAASELLDRPDRPDAIYATYDRLGLGTLLAAESHRIAVPDDLLVAACTDSAAARNAIPPLTTLNLNAETLGSEAARLLLDMVESDSTAPGGHVTVPTRIVPRASSRRRTDGSPRPRPKPRPASRPSDDCSVLPQGSSQCLTRGTSHA